MIGSWKYYNVEVALVQRDTFGNSTTIKAAIFDVRARSKAEAGNKALAREEAQRHPAYFGITFGAEVRNVWEIRPRFEWWH